MDPANKPALPEMETVLEMFEEQVAAIPGHLAVTEGGNRITYKGLDDRAELIASKIRAESGNNEFVAILLPQGVEFISSLYGGWKTGRAVAPIDVGNSKTQIAFILEELKNPLLITSREHFGKVPDYPKIITVSDRDLIGVQPDGKSREERALERSKLAFIIFTSGSTGRPKGVMIPHRVISRVTKSAWSLREISPSDKSMTYSSPAFILSFSEYITLLARGGTVYVPPTELRHDMDKLHEFICENEITVLSMPTSAGIKIMERDMPSLRWLRIGGEKLIVPVNDNKPFKILYVYGASETFAISFRVSFGTGIPNNGPLALGVQVWFLDENLHEVKQGEVGEICVASHTITDGYLNNPQLTSERYITNPFNPNQILFRTGDLGYLNSSGELVVCGRADFQVKIMGNRIELGQVEFALVQHPNIKQAAAIVVDKNGAKTISAFCVPVEGRAIPDLNSLCNFLGDHLPRYAFPSQVVSLEAIPMTTSGKFNREALKGMKVVKVIEPLVTPTEIKMGGIWSKTLKIPMEEISRTDSFFSLGGNSLQLALVVTKLQAAPWFLNVRIKHLSKVPRLDEFSALVDKCKGGKVDLSEFIKDEQSEPDFDSDSQLDRSFPEVISAAAPETAQNILITGSTGYVGANFLQVLLQRAKEAPTVHCLIRAKNNAEAKERLSGTLVKYRLTIPQSVFDSRVVCVAADISKYQFGLGTADYRRLCETIDVIYHIAAEVHFLKYYSELRDSNVGGTRWMLNFSVESKPKFLHYISTFSVIGRDCVDETILESPDQLFRINERESKDMGYSQSKRVAEKLVWKAIERGLPAIVYRLGEIGCHSKLNVVNDADFLARLFQTCQETGIYPLMDKKLPYGSIDFTCEGIMCIAEQASLWKGKCFHVFENQISYLEGFRSMNGLVGLGITEWISKIAEIIETHPNPQKQEEYSILLQLMQNAGGSSVLDKKFSISNLKAALSGHAVSFNPNQDWSRYLSVLLTETKLE